MSISAPEPSEVDKALAALDDFEVALKVSTGQKDGHAEMPEVVLDRLSVERRVLGHITDEVEFTALGSRNTLAALTYSLMRDRNTTNAPPPNPSLDIKGKSVGEVAQAILDILTDLVSKGLAEVREDGAYALTELGHTELAN